MAIPYPLIIIFAAAILIWLIVLTVFFVKIFAHYKRLVKNVNEGNLETVLTKILEREDLNKRNITDINNRVSALQKDGLGHIQKIGMSRFNPFNETGGDNSFTICLMNAKLDGLVLTGLHTREKTRIYAKKLENGKSQYELSKEEVKAIAEASK